MKLLIFSVSLAALFFSSSSLAAADTWECFAGKIRLREGKIRSEQKLELCSNKERTRLRSANCQKNQCAALGPHKLDPKLHTLPLGQGSPGFKYCVQAGGMPQLLEFFDGKRWWELDRCYFSSDKSFVNTGLLP